MSKTQASGKKESVVESQPEWMKQVNSKYQAGIAHSFILHFNVSDYVAPESEVNLRAYLAARLAKRPIVVFYNRAEGLTFVNSKHEEEFRNRLGLNQATSSDPALSALLGTQPGDGKMPLPKDPAEALGLLERLLVLQRTEEEKSDEPLAAVIIDHAEMIAPAADIAAMNATDRTILTTLLRWGTLPAIIRSGNMVFLVSENITDLNPALRAASTKWESIEIPLPDRKVRKRYIDLKMESGETKWGVEADPLANMTAGLSLIHIEDIFLRANQEKELTQDLVRERKNSIIDSEYAEVIEILEPQFGWNGIGGLECVKKAMEERIVRPIREGRRGQVPMGVLMLGAAGTGKTAVAEALAYEAKINFLILNMARILGQYVGQSERNLEKAWRAILSLAPTIVFIDEIDQSLQRGGGGDSGVSNRIFKRLMEVMSDTSHRGKVVFLAASNRPDLMDAALKRPGRFDLKIPFFIPNDEERKGIFQVMASKYKLDVSDIPTKAIEATKGWTGAEIELATVKAISLTENEGLSPQVALEQAVRRISPSTSDIELMTALALNEVNDIDLVPESMREQLRDRKKLAGQVKELRQDTAETGGRSGRRGEL